jgi:hypothetical protein
LRNLQFIIREKLSREQARKTDLTAEKCRDKKRRKRGKKAYKAAAAAALHSPSFASPLAPSFDTA